MTSRDEAIAWFEDLGERFSARTHLQWGVAEAEGGRIVGTVTLHSWHRDNRRAEIGYILGAPHWGRALGAEAVDAVIRFAFDAMGLHRIEADTDPGNAASIRMLEGLGFVREGVLAQRWYVADRWHDSALYGLLRPNFRPFVTRPLKKGGSGGVRGDGGSMISLLTTVAVSPVAEARPNRKAPTPAMIENRKLRKEGSLKPGDPAPDSNIVRPDGQPGTLLASKAAGRPLVLIFGSFT